MAHASTRHRSRPPRDRVVFVALALGTLGLGLLVHSSAWAVPGAVRDKLGDGLWATMVVWWVGVLVPRAPVWSRSLAALAFCWTVEASQLYHAPWLEVARATTLGQLVLGSGFDAGDLGAYALGVLAAAMGETIVRRRRERRQPGSRGAHPTRR